jgi:EmrB/QacA subfamily drug resistance transporter
MGKWWPLVAVCLGAFMLLVDVTIVTVALPQIAVDLRASFSGLQWIIDGYTLALAALLLGAGSVADRWGRRRTYVAGLALFAAASLACGLAPSAEVLVAARFAQGVGGAAMFATTMALLNVSYRGPDRAVAFGVWGAVLGAAAAAGPMLGGLLTHQLDWRAIFLVNLPISVVAIVLTLRVLRESRDPEARRVDLPGVVTFAIAAGSATYALIRAGEEGWTGSGTAIWFGLAAVALIAFLAVERRSAHGMLDLGLFRSPTFVGIMLAATLLPVAAFAYPVYLSLWLQSVLGLEAVHAGLALVPMSALAFVVAAGTARLLQHVSPRLTIGIGLLVIGTGTMLQALLVTTGSWAAVLPGLAVAGIGVGLASPALASAGMAAVPYERAGMASGAVNTFRQLGTALGIAAFGTVFRARVEAVLESRIPDPRAATDALTAGRVDAVQAQVPESARGALDHLLREAFGAGLSATLMLASVTGVVCGVLTLLLVRRSAPPAADPNSDDPESDDPTRVGLRGS